MEKREAGRKFSRTVPVIIENHENATKKTKLMVPSNYTAGQLANILRSRMHLLPYHPVYLFLKSKQSPVLMSKSIGHLHLKHRDEKGLLRLIQAEQASFGFRGNIRAIRFRQKWIENLHNISHHDASDDAYSGVPPPYFPLDPPSITNFGTPPAPLDINQLNGPVEPLPANENFFVDLVYELANGNETNQASDLAISDSSTTFSSESSTSEESSQSSTLTNFSLPVIPALGAANAIAVGASNGFATAYSAHHHNHCLSHSGADPWLSSSATNSLETSSVVVVLEDDEVNSELDQLIVETYNSIMSDDNPYSANVQPLNVSNSQESHLIEHLYESDSDFYDSDKDVDE